MSDEQKLAEAHKMLTEAVRLEKEAIHLCRQARALLSPPKPGKDRREDEPE